MTCCMHGYLIAIRLGNLLCFVVCISNLCTGIYYCPSASWSILCYNVLCHKELQCALILCALYISKMFKLFQYLSFKTLATCLMFNILLTCINTPFCELVHILMPFLTWCVHRYFVPSHSTLLHALLHFPSSMSIAYNSKQLGRLGKVPFSTRFQFYVGSLELLGPLPVLNWSLPSLTDNFFPTYSISVAFYNLQMSLLPCCPQHQSQQAGLILSPGGSTEM